MTGAAASSNLRGPASHIRVLDFLRGVAIFGMLSGIKGARILQSNKSPTGHEEIAMSGIKPTLGSERLQVVDALRGFALFGILLANLVEGTSLRWQLTHAGQTRTYDTLYDLTRYVQSFPRTTPAES